ncbi:MAG: Ig-like domain-containing protein [Terriglobales bacterium]
MPANNANGIGPNNPITVTFSEPMTPPLLTNGKNVALYDGSTLLATGISLSADATAVTFNGMYLPYGHTITVVVNPAVTDLAGNPMGTEFSSSFTVMNRPDTSQPSVTAFRPGAGASGVAATVTPTFFLSQPIDPSTVANALLVSQNGALVSGSVAVSASGQVVTFTPAAPFQAGAVVQIWFTSAATDPSGNPLAAYQTSFSIAADHSGAAPSLVSLSPDRYLPSNGVLDVQFDQPLAPASVTGASVYLRQGGGGAIQAATLSLLAGNTVVRLAPSAPLAPSTTYCLFLTTGITNPASIAYAGTERCYSTAAGADSSPLDVTAIAPTDGASGIGVNAAIRVTFSKAPEYLTVTPDTLQLTSNGTAIPYSFSLDSPGSTLTLTPQAPLPASAPVTVHVTSGVTDYAGQGAADFTATFQTGAAPVYSTPQVVASTVADGDANVPVTAGFTVSFDRPLDARSVNGNNVYLYDNFLSARVAGTLATSSDGTQVMFTPSAPLALGRPYSFRGCSLTDLNGNSACWTFYYTFTTALTAPAGGPQVVMTTPAAGFSNQPVNLMPEIAFDRPVTRASTANIQLLQSGTTPVAFTTAFGNADSLVQIVPTAVLQPNTPYVLHIAGVTDASGTAMTAPVEVSFTTGGGFDLVSPQVISATPINGSTTGTQPVLRVVFNEPVDPIRNNGWYVHDQSAGAASATHVQAHYSADRTVMTLSFDALQPSSNYNWGTGTVYDAAGNSSYFSYNFSTNAGGDTTPPSVTSATPPDGATGVPLNAVVVLQLSQPLDPTTVSSSSLGLSPAVAGTVSLNGGGTLLQFTPSAGLAPNTTYTVTAGGVADESGNALPPYEASFTTAGTVLSGSGTAALTSPAPNATGVDVNSSLHLTFSRPVDPLSVSGDTLAVEAKVGNTWIVTATQITLASDGLSATLTPLAPLPGNSQIWVGVSYYANLLDLTGTSISGLQASFTTGAPAPSVPQVIAVTPGDGASGVGPNAVVTLQFNESLNPAAINGSNFALYSGYTNLNASVNRSSDNRTVTLSVALPYGSTITVAAGTGVTDLAGNAMAAPFRSSFTTIAYPHTGTPSFNEMRPGNGASGVPLDSVITLYASAAISAASLTGHVLVTENGSAWDGTAALAGSGQAIVYTPTTPFDAGALVQIFISGGLTDIYGNPFNSYSASFRTQPDLSGAALTLVSIPQNSSGNPTNTAVVVVFNKPINPATVSSGTFYLTQNGTPVAATLSQPEPNVLRLQPGAPLAANSYYVIYLTSGLQDTTGMSFSGGGWGMWTGAGADTSLPAVVSIVPQDGTTGVGDNTSLRVTFNKAIDTNSLNPDTLQLSNNGTPLAYSLSLGSQNNATVAVVQPQAPLPDGGPVTLTLTSGITDYEANGLAPASATFTTGYGSDYASPQLVYSSPTSDANQNVPAGAVFVFRFNEPIDSTRWSGSLRNYTAGQWMPISLQLSPDGTTVTLIPTGGLAAGSQFIGCVTAYDLAGNGGGSYCTATVYTAATPDPSLPQAVVTAPVANEVNVPTNALIEILFNKVLAGNGIGQATLSANGNPVAQQTSLVNGGRVVRLTPAALLAPNTVYTVTLSGFQDLGGDAMATPFSYQFTTGPNPDLSNATNFQTASVTVGGVATQLSTNSTLSGVDVGTVLTVTFSNPVLAPYLWTNGAVQLVNTNTSAVVPATLALSSDGRTLTLTPQAPLAGATGYTLQVNYYNPVYALAGYNVSGYGLFKFTTP